MLERQEAFDDQILPVLAAAARRVVFTTREPALLNHLLRFPRGGLTGWLIRGDAGASLALVFSVVPQPGGIRLGRIVDCLLASEDARLMSSAAFRQRQTSWVDRASTSPRRSQVRQK
ncbi:MAG: hypothetical protein U0794_19600 [Isosphaeraceae bacterium]